MVIYFICLLLIFCARDKTTDIHYRDKNISKDENVPLQINWNTLGMEKNKTRLFSPEIEGLQVNDTFKIDQPVPVKKNQGLILVLEARD